MPAWWASEPVYRAAGGLAATQVPRRFLRVHGCAPRRRQPSSAPLLCDPCAHGMLSGSGIFFGGGLAGPFLFHQYMTCGMQAFGRGSRAHLDTPMSMMLPPPSCCVSSSPPNRNMSGTEGSSQSSSCRWPDLRHSGTTARGPCVSTTHFARLWVWNGHGTAACKRQGRAVDGRHKAPHGGQMYTVRFMRQPQEKGPHHLLPPAPPLCTVLCVYILGETRSPLSRKGALPAVMIRCAAPHLAARWKGSRCVRVRMRRGSGWLRARRRRSTVASMAVWLGSRSAADSYCGKTGKARHSTAQHINKQPEGAAGAARSSSIRLHVCFFTHRSQGWIFCPSHARHAR